MGKFKDLSNLQFGKLTVSNQYKIENKKTFWFVKCDCGQEKWMRADYLTKNAKSCGLCEGNEIIGEKFGELIVLKRLDKKHKQEHYKFLCQCSCGEFRESSLGHLKDGHSTKCEKCYRKYPEHKYHKKLYKCWFDMKDRCYKKNTNSYKYYGERGIVVCEDWRNDYIKFRDWSITNGFSEFLEIDRIDVNGNYEPNNCRWVTRKENVLNTRRNVYIEGLALSQISEKHNIKYATLWARYKRLKETENEITLKDLIW